MTRPQWGPRTDTERLDWLLANTRMPGLSGNRDVDRKAIDDAIAREEFRKVNHEQM